MDYGTLKERLVELLGRPAMPLAYSLARTSLDRSLRIVAMEKTVTIAAIDGAIALPDDFIEPQAVKGPSGCFYTPIGYEKAARLGTQNTAPHFVLGAGSLDVTPQPADGAEFSVVYFAKLAELSDDTDTNVALQAAPEAFIYSVLAEHARLIRDGGALQFWEGQAGGKIADANKAAVKARFNGGAIEVTAGGTVV